MTAFADVYPSVLLRRAIVGGCRLVVAALLVWHIPVPGLRGTVRDALRPAFTLTQLEQDWALFAPEVSQPSTFVHIEVVRDDGSVERIDFPSGEPWIGTYRGYRWSSYEEALLDVAVLRDDALAYALDEVGPAGVARIELVLMESDVPTDDHGPFTPDYERIVLATVTP